MIINDVNFFSILSITFTISFIHCEFSFDVNEIFFNMSHRLSHSVENHKIFLEESKIELRRDN